MGDPLDQLVLTPDGRQIPQRQWNLEQQRQDQTAKFNSLLSHPLAAGVYGATGNETATGLTAGLEDVGYSVGAAWGARPQAEAPPKVAPRSFIQQGTNGKDRKMDWVKPFRGPVPASARGQDVPDEGLDAFLAGERGKKPSNQDNWWAFSPAELPRVLKGPRIGPNGFEPGEGEFDKALPQAREELFGQPKDNVINAVPKLQKKVERDENLKADQIRQEMERDLWAQANTKTKGSLSYDELDDASRQEWSEAVKSENALKPSTQKLLGEQKADREKLYDAPRTPKGAPLADTDGDAMRFTRPPSGQTDGPDAPVLSYTDKKKSVLRDQLSKQPSPADSLKPAEDRLRKEIGEGGGGEGGPPMDPKDAVDALIHPLYKLILRRYTGPEQQNPANKQYPMKDQPNEQ